MRASIVLGVDEQCDKSTTHPSVLKVNLNAIVETEIAKISLVIYD